MEKGPLISIILPVYNCDKYLDESIQSILSQDYTNWELLLIYDKSLDKSLDIIKSHISKNKKIKIFYNTNKSLKNALNLGIRKSKGEFLARMDSDDISYSDRLKEQISFMNYNNLDICGSHYIEIDEFGKQTDKRYVPVSHKNCLIRLASSVPFPHSSVMIRKSFLIENDIMYWSNTKNYPEDLDLWIKIHDFGGSFGNVDRILIKYRVWKNSSSSTNKIFSRNQSILLYNNFFKKNFFQLKNNLYTKSKTKTDEYYRLRLIFRIIIVKMDCKMLKYLSFSSLGILIKAFLVEVKNYFIFISFLRKQN